MSRFIEELESRLISPESWDKKDIPEDMKTEITGLIERDYLVAVGKDRKIGYFILFMKDNTADKNLLST